MVLDVLKFRRVLERRYVPVQMPHPLVEVWIASADVANVALEVLYVDRIEAHDGGVETDVSFGDGGRRKEVRSRRLGEARFEAIEGFEELSNCFCVCFFGPDGLWSVEKMSIVTPHVRCKTGFVYSIVHVVVHPFVHFLNVLSQLLGEKVHLLVLVLDYIVKSGVEHSNDLTTFVAHNPVRLLVI
jgi:hypothetical protein